MRILNVKIVGEDFGKSLSPPPQNLLLVLVVDFSRWVWNCATIESAALSYCIQLATLFMALSWLGQSSD